MLPPLVFGSTYPSAGTFLDDDRLQNQRDDGLWCSPDDMAREGRHNMRKNRLVGAIGGNEGEKERKITREETVSRENYVALLKEWLHQNIQPDKILRNRGEQCLATSSFVAVLSCIARGNLHTYSMNAVLHIGLCPVFGGTPPASSLLAIGWEMARTCQEGEVQGV